MLVSTQINLTYCYIILSLTFKRGTYYTLYIFFSILCSFPSPLQLTKNLVDMYIQQIKITPLIPYWKMTLFFEKELTIYKLRSKKKKGRERENKENHMLHKKKYR